jgi:hypothetical protein
VKSYLVIGHFETGLHASDSRVCDVTPVLFERNAGYMLDTK